MLLGQWEIIDEIDTLASENFINKFVLMDHELQRKTACLPHGLLAAVGATIVLEGTVTLSPVLQDVPYPATFYVSSELRSEMILGRPWLKSHKVIHDYVTDCIFFGTTGRQRVYLNPLAHSPESPPPRRRDLYNTISLHNTRMSLSNSPVYMLPCFMAADT